MKTLSLILISTLLIGCKTAPKTVVVSGYEFHMEQSRENAKRLTPTKSAVATNNPPVPFVPRQLWLVWDCDGTNGEVFVVERSTVIDGPRTVLASNLVEKSFAFTTIGEAGFFHVSSKLPP